MTSACQALPISPWVQKYTARLATRSQVLDLACGRGRHARYLLDQGHVVTALDRDLSGVADLAEHTRARLIQADLEASPWPLTGQRFDAVVVCNYLHRPLMAHIIDTVAAGGLLIYSTFAAGNERFGRPRNPDFLLRANELLAWADDDFIVYGYEHGPVEQPRPAMRQSMCALRIK